MSSTNAFVVVLDHDMSDEESDLTLAALRQIKGVLSVEPNTTDISDLIAKGRVRAEVFDALYKTLFKENESRQ